ncbi:MAG: alpha/beta hydrolase [Chloroflexota bacterium]|nr:alpha/beta hydrolase [Chloroflexota bacterium]
MAAAPILVACLPSVVARPVGAAPLRYRDEVFSNVTVTSDLQYGAAPGVDGNASALKLDLYQPAGDKAAARPALIWVHGGGYAGGDKAIGPSAFLANEFARLGYVTVSINYRLLAPHGCTAAGGISATCLAAGVAAVNDAQAAVRWLRANAATYRIDLDRIGIGGESAGAITATGVGVDSDQVGNSGNPGYSSKVNAWVSISGGVPGGVFVDNTDPPGFLFSGTADGTVPYRWSVETATAMQAAGVPVFLKTLEGAGHVPWVQYQDLFESQSDDFFYEFLDDAHASS